MDTLRIGRFSSGGRFSADLDLMTSTYNRERGTLKVSPATPTVRTIPRARPYGGARATGVTHDNGQVAATFWVKGTDVNDAVVRARALAAQVNSFVEGRFLEWKPGGTLLPAYYDLRGPGALSPQPFNVLAFEGANLWAFDIVFPTGPAALGAPMDISDEFVVDSLADYTFDAGAATLSVTGGALIPSSTSQKRIYHSARGYSVTDQRVTLRYVTGAAVAAQETGVTLSRQGAASALVAQTQNNNTLRIIRRDTGAVLATTAATIAAATEYWIRFRREGALLVAEHWTTEPVPAGTPAATLTYTLTAAEALAFPAGPAGIEVTPNGTDYVYKHFIAQPFTYVRTFTNAAFVLDSVPGDLPALVDIDVGGGANTAALFGWLERPATYNLVWNGDFEWNLVPTAGWAVVAVTNITAAATSIARTATGLGKFYGPAGSFGAVVTTPATIDAGAQFRIFRRFRRGVTYTFGVWIQSAGGAANNVYARLGNSGANDKASSTPIAQPAAYTFISSTWRPAADYDEAHFAVNQVSATASSFRIDGAVVYEGTTPPATGKQVEGQGGYPPLGILQAESARQVGGDLTLQAGAYDGGLAYDTGAVLGSAGGDAVEWYVDPALVVPDDFAGGIIDVEVYVNALVDGNPMTGRVMTAYADYTEGGGPIVYTAEYGKAGRSLGDVTTALHATEGRIWRRAGTLSLDTTLGRCALGVSFTWASAVTGRLTVDRIALVPARGQLTSPQGVAATATIYPFFSVPPSGTTGVKRTRYDRSGAFKSAGRPWMPANPLGGEPCELDPGVNEFVVVFPGNPIDLPNDGTGAPGADPADQTYDIHVAVQPRYHLARGPS